MCHLFKGEDDNPNSKETDLLAYQSMNSKRDFSLSFFILFYGRRISSLTHRELAISTDLHSPRVSLVEEFKMASSSD